MRGNGGFTNRAGRRSGGSRPFVIDVPRVPDDGQRFRCPDCNNCDLPLLVTSGCMGCRMIVELHRAGKLTSTPTGAGADAV